MTMAQRPQFLFNFALVPLADVVPWGQPDAPSLHWFGLTQGQYWFAAGDDLLLEYSAEEVAKSGLPRFCDYYVARFHEDLLAMLPSVLEPVPDDLAPWLQRPNCDVLRAWEPDTDDEWDARDLALSWIDLRRLDVGYLSPAADIRLWSDRTCVHIAWDNRGILKDGAPAWSAQLGTISLQRSLFEAQVASFHVRFMSDMSDRLKAVVSGALDGAIAIDLGALQREQGHRQHALATALASAEAATDWVRVRHATAIARARNGPMRGDA